MNKNKLSALCAAVLSGALLFSACTPKAPEVPAPEATATPFETAQQATVTPTNAPTPSDQPAATSSQEPDAGSIVPPEPIGTPDSNPGPAQIPQNEPVILKYVGIYDGTTDESGEEQLYLKSPNGGDPSADLLVTPTKNTAIIDAETGDKLDIGGIKKGAMVIASTSPQLTRSIPPQSTELYAVVANVPQTPGPVPVYIEIYQVTEREGEYTIENENRDLIITVPPEVASSMTVFGSGQTATGSALKEGAKIFAWVGPVAQSYPAQGTAEKIMVVE